MGQGLTAVSIARTLATTGSMLVGIFIITYKSKGRSVLVHRCEKKGLVQFNKIYKCQLQTNFSSYKGIFCFVIFFKKLNNCYCDPLNIITGGDWKHCWCAGSESRGCARNNDGHRECCCRSGHSPGTGPRNHSAATHCIAIS